MPGYNGIDEIILIGTTNSSDQPIGKGRQTLIDCRPRGGGKEGNMNEKMERVIEKLEDKGIEGAQETANSVNERSRATPLF